VPLPHSLEWTAEREALQDAETAVLAVPTRYFRDVVSGFSGILPPSCGIVSVAKGLDAASRERMTVVARDVLHCERVAALSGPSHAEEVARDIPTAVTVASNDPDHARAVQEMFAGRTFRLYTTNDVAGVEFGGAFKNIAAIAVGVSDGLGFGDNTRAALITRGLAEITRLGCALGARTETFAGLSGMGDLIVTCTSRLSRNRAIGERLGRGESIDEILGSTQQAAEGAWNCAIARTLARERGVDVPVTDEVYALVHEHKRPADAVTSLLQRDLKAE
jgi:glycerol-3-phosphate dehydrogenase (NAD(P)+)